MKKFSFLDNPLRALLRAAGNTVALHSLVQFFTLSLIAISLTACLDPVGKMDDTVVANVDSKFVLPAIVSPASTLTPATSTAVADNVATATITVTLVDLNTAAPIAGKTVSLASNRISDTISAASGASSALGVVTFTVTSTTAGVSTFKAVDTTDSITLVSTAAVTWTSPVAIASVTTTTSSDSYKTGTPINVTVTFSVPVIVTNTPQIILGTTPNRTVNYASGSGTKALIFTYTVQPGDTSTHLDYLGTTALALGGGSIKDTFGNDAILTLPALGTSGLYTTSIAIDTTAPTVASVTTTTSSGSYKTGTPINVTVNFSEAVIVSGTPVITLGTTPNQAVSYSSGSGTSALVFAYTVQPGDTASRLDYLNTSALALSGGTIQDSALNDANLALPATGTSGLYSANVIIDTTAPTVAGVNTTTSAGSYKALAIVSVTVTFSKTVWITGIPQITLNTTPHQLVNYASGSGSSALVFTYTVQPGDTAARLDYLNTAALALNNGTIKDSPGNSANLTLPATGTSGLYAANIIIDTTAPSVASVTTTNTTGTYGINTVINVVIGFSEAVGVTGTPQITLGTTPSRVATYFSGTGTNSLVFQYTVQSGDTGARLDYTNINSLALNLGLIQDAAGNNAILTLPPTTTSSFYIKNLVLDTVRPTVVLTSTTAANPTTAGTLAMQATFSKTVTGFDASKLTSSSGAVSAFTPVSGTVYTFTFTPTAGTTGTLTVDIASGKAHDAANNDNSAATQFSRAYYAKTPSASGTTPSTSTTPSITVANIIASSGTGLTATIYSDACTNSMGTATPSGASQAVNSAPIAASTTYYTDLTDNDGNHSACSLVFAYALAPAIISVTAPADDTYISEQTMDFSVAYSQNVDVANTPRMALDVGGSTNYAYYLSGTGSSTLIFRYTVAVGDVDVDGITLSSPLDLNTLGTIQSSADGTTADLTFLPPITTAVLVDATDVSGLCAGPAKGPSAPFHSGNGSSGDPWGICNSTELNQIRDAYGGNDFILLQSFDASALPLFAGLFVNNTAYAATFDGNNQKIINLTITGVTDDSGLLGQISSSAQILNLNLVNVTANGSGLVTGGLVGLNVGGLIQNCSTSGSVTGLTVAGGLVGTNGSTGRVLSSSSSAAVSGGDNTGGLVGTNQGIMINSFSAGAVGSMGNTGGLAGYSNGAITNSYASNAGYDPKATIAAGLTGGGLVGVNDTGATITDSYSTFEVDGASTQGGFAGQNSGTISASYATGAVNGDSHLGGFAGDNLGTIVNSYATGAVTATTDRFGGFAGTSSGTIVYSYSTSATTGPDVGTNGGVVGVNTGTVQHSYWLNGTGQTISYGGSPLSGAQMNDSSNFKNWDFNYEWTSSGSAPPTLRRGTAASLLCQSAAKGPSIPFHSGNGSGGNPYGICTAAELNSIGSDPNYVTNNYILLQSIDMTGVNFKMIGSFDHPFTGTFDGALFPIVDLTITVGSGSYSGMIAYASNATIKNVHLLSTTSTNTTSVAGANGLLVGGLAGTSAVINSYTTGSVSGGDSLIVEQTTLGGLVGSMMGPNPQMITSFSTANVLGYASYVGGLVGAGSGTTIQSFATGRTDAGVQGGGDAGNAGGLCGESSGPIHISFATGASTNTGVTGGLVGLGNSNIDNSFATGSIIQGGQGSGGLVGQNAASGAIVASFATGSIVATNGAGGLVGRNAGSLSLSYATGDVSANSAVGALVGQTTAGSSIATSYGRGATTDTSFAPDPASHLVGGLVGESLGGVIVTDAYWDSTISPFSYSGLGSGLGTGNITKDMKDSSQYIGADWTFGAAWTIDPNDNQGYPTLR